MTDFTSLVAVITGGTGGIGAATAAVLTGRGARVAVLDRTVRAGDSDGPWTLAVRCDITDDAAFLGAIAEVVDTLGGIDVLINNAGVGAVGDIAANDDAEWLRVFDVNVFGMARVTRAALPYLRRSGHASIVNTCSVVAGTGVPQRALYSASKGAVASLTLAMAADHVREGIRVNAVLPGTADTAWVARLLDQAADPTAAATALRLRQPTGRLVSAGEVAQSIAYLASPLSASTTGTLLAVDGGMAGLRIG
jgi:2-keto-3-deoxy-L-fuconate dehydrogenase